MIKTYFNISFSDLTFERQEAIKEDLKERIKIVYLNESRIEAIELLNDDEIEATEENIKNKIETVIEDKADLLIQNTFNGEGTVNEENIWEHQKIKSRK